MQDQTTIFYKLKLKRTRTPSKLFEKLQKSIKKKGATKDWVCTVDEEKGYMSVDFGEDKGETFCLKFDDKKVCEGCCKVYFPLSGELFDDEKKSEFKALINMIYSAKAAFSKMEITDDYGITESYLDSKVNKISLRELTEEENERARRIFENGQQNVKEFITALMYDYRDLPYSEDFIPYINIKIGNRYIGFWDSYDKLCDFFESFVDSFLYETSEYQDKGRLKNVKDYYGDLNGVYFAVSAFITGIDNITGYRIFEKGWDPKSTQVIRLYYNKYLPLAEAKTDNLGKCVLAYRFFVSIMDYLGFKAVKCMRKEGSFISKELADAAKAMLDGSNFEEYRNAVWNEMKKNQ